MDSVVKPENKAAQTGKSVLPPLPDGVHLRIYLQMRYSENVVREATIESQTNDIRDADVRNAVTDAIRTLLGKQGAMPTLIMPEKLCTVEPSVDALPSDKLPATKQSQGFQPQGSGNGPA